MSNELIKIERTQEGFLALANEIIKNDLKEKYFKVKECLSRCGNSVIEISNKEDIENYLGDFKGEMVESISLAALNQGTSFTLFFTL